MNLVERFAVRRNRLAALAAAAVGAVTAVAGAFSGTDALLGVGAAVVSVVFLIALKLVLELVTNEAHIPVAGLAARIDGQDEAQVQLALEQQHLADVVDAVDARAERRSQDQAAAIEELGGAVRASDDAIRDSRVAQDAIADQLTALEARLTPSRRFSAVKPTRDGTPRELALGEVLSASSVEPHATD